MANCSVCGKKLGVFDKDTVIFDNQSFPACSRCNSEVNRAFSSLVLYRVRKNSISYLQDLLDNNACDNQVRSHLEDGLGNLHFVNCPNCDELIDDNVTICPFCKFDKSTGKVNDLSEAEILALQKQREQREQNFEKEMQGFRTSALPGAVFHIQGSRGRMIDIYPHKCIITTDVTLGAVLTGNATDGRKTIFYQDCVGFQVKAPGLALGYIQIETSGSLMNNEKSNFFNENTFTFDTSQLSEQAFAYVVDYLTKQIEATKKGSLFSPADEIRKYKSLFDEGAITEAEYETKKTQLLSLGY